MIRVLQITPSLNCCGGVENYIMNYYRKIDKSKIQFDFIYHLESPINFIDEITRLGGKVFKQPEFSIKNIKIIKKNLYNILKEQKYDIIHCHQANAAFLYSKLAKKMHIKVRILHSHQTQASDSFFHSIRNIPLLYFGKKYSNVYFACSILAGNYLFKKSKFIVINNAIESNKYSYNEKNREMIRCKFNISKSDFLIGHVGRFCNQKNQIFLLKLFKDMASVYPNLKLMLIGDGELRPKILRHISNYNLEEKVILTGAIDNVYLYYSAMDLIVMPSLYEGLPVVGVEAQYNGLNLIVSSNVTKELNFSNNVTYIDLKKYDEWKRCIEYFISNNKRNNVTSAEYDIISQSKNLENVYIELYEN